MKYKKIWFCPCFSCVRERFCVCPSPSCEDIRQIQTSWNKIVEKLGLAFSQSPDPRLTEGTFGTFFFLVFWEFDIFDSCFNFSFFFLERFAAKKLPDWCLPDQMRLIIVVLLFPFFLLLVQHVHSFCGDAVLENGRLYASLLDYWQKLNLYCRRAVRWWQ